MKRLSRNFRYLYPTVILIFIVLSFSLLSCGDDDDSSSDMKEDDNANDDDDNDDNDDNDDTTDDDDDNDDESMKWLFAQGGELSGIYDEEDRQVLLRGVNFNHLGDYFLSDPELPTVSELSDEDWDDAAAEGHNVIRLVTSWSFWQPERNSFNEVYLDRVKEAIDAANGRGMYVVIDMHQDAWSKFVFTPADETCPVGTRHQIGWDGAPAWATFIDGEQTCTPGSREDSPAVIAAWDNFYANRDGIRDELVALWGRIAAEFADHPGVAGYDLLNEPGNGSSIIATQNGITRFYRDAISEIRAVEAETKSPGHIIFFEPSVFGVPPAFNLTGENIAFAPHNYFESIVSGPAGLLDFSFLLYSILGRIYDTPLWCGEFGSFSDEQTNEDWRTRYADLEDRFLFAGGAWWQWEQECGDPHDVNHQYPPSSGWIEEQKETCGNSRMKPAQCGSRAYPRAAPGRLMSLSAVPCGESLTFGGFADAPGLAEIWFPSESEDEPDVSGSGIDTIEKIRVPGGWLIGATVIGDYEVVVEAATR